MARVPHWRDAGTAGALKRVTASQELRKRVASATVSYGVNEVATPTNDVAVLSLQINRDWGNFQAALDHTLASSFFGNAMGNEPYN